MRLLALCLMLSRYANIHVLADANVTLAPSITAIPSLWSSYCYDGAPCTAYCRPNNTDCQNAANAIANSCSPSWSSYIEASLLHSNLGPQWTSLVMISAGGIITWTITSSVYTTVSTTNATFVRFAPDHESMTTFTPVYGLGSPIPSYIERTASVEGITRTIWSAPTPDCKFTKVETTMASKSCGSCTLEGGTVGLYYWPPETSTSTKGNLTMQSTAAMSTVLDGTTLYSPTVYISLATAFATNQCGQIGGNHTGTLLAMNPADVSTQVQLGGKVWANSFGQLLYEDLTALPPATNYQLQPSCIMFGCPTMEPTFNPTLSVPAQMRSMDVAWKDCLLPLQGLYDPPQALTAASAVAKPTLPGQPLSHTSKIEPAMTVSSGQALKTTQPSPSNEAQQITGLLDVIAGIDSADPTASSPTTTAKDPGGIAAYIAAGLSILKETTEAQTVAITSSAIEIFGETSVARTSQDLLGVTALAPPGEEPRMYTTIVSLDKQGNFVVNSQSIVTGSPTMLTVDGVEQTAYLLTTSGKAFLAPETSNLALSAKVKTSSAEHGGNMPTSGLTANGQGDLLSGSSNVQPGDVSALGSGSSTNTLSLISTSGETASVVDGIVETTKSTTEAIRTNDPTSSGSSLSGSDSPALCIPRGILLSTLLACWWFVGAGIDQSFAQHI